MSMITSSDLEATLRVLQWYSECSKEEYLQALQPALRMKPQVVASKTGLNLETIYAMRKKWWQESDRKHDFTTAVKLLTL